MKKPVQLNYEQAKELKWFCQSVVGIKKEYYAIELSVLGFARKLERLEKTCTVIEKFLGERIEPYETASEENQI